jgi:hypothetical protein
MTTDAMPSGVDPAGVLADVAVVLRTVLAAVDAGDLPAETDQVAYLRGAADALALAADPPGGSGTP